MKSDRTLQECRDDRWTRITRASAQRRRASGLLALVVWGILGLAVAGVVLLVVLQ